MRDITTVWSRIAEHEGEIFHQVQGAEFTYKIQGRAVKPDRTNRLIPLSDFEKALPHAPFQTTTEVKGLGVQGPSYVYAILMDHRIRQDDW